MKNTNQKYILLWMQGIYFALTGIWPFVHLKSFLWVTGPKNDLWLLKTVAALITAIGLTFLLSAYRREINAAVITLALSSAFSLMVIDIYYATNDVIWNVYLLDAVAEAIFIGAWIIFLSKPNPGL